LLLLPLLACQPAPGPSSPSSDRAAEPSEPTTPASDAVPEPVEPVAPVEPASAPAPERWRVTTLVTGATEAYESLIGANGYYELSISGDTATVVRVGQTGTAQLGEAKRSTGTGTLIEADNREWPSARRRTLELELVAPEDRRRLRFDLWFFADEIHGSWAAPNPKDTSRVGNSWGLVAGQKLIDDAPPRELKNGADAPCMVCVRAFWNCEGTGFEGPACNSANMAWDRCADQVAKAQAGGGEVPRGCGDYML
jgi:hypothetical protein